MRVRVLAFGCVSLLSACVTLGGIDQSPDRSVVANLLRSDLACREKEGDEAKCDPAEQPKEIRLTALNCDGLPLRTAVREAAHARCAFDGEIVRASGRTDPLPAGSREFSLIELTPGSRLPERVWTIVRKP